MKFTFLGLGVIGVIADIFVFSHFLDEIPNYTQSTYITAIIALAGAIVTMFWLWKKSTDSHTKELQAMLQVNSEKIEKLYKEKEVQFNNIYEKIIAETKQSNDKLSDMVDENNKATKALEVAIRSLPSELKKALKA